MDANYRDLLARLAVGPAFLLLGQRSADTSVTVRAPESVVAEPIDGSEARRTYAEALVAFEESAAPPDLALIDRSAEAAGASSGLATVLRFPWNGVYTSRIDSAMAAQFLADWRRVVPTALAQVGRHARSSTEVQVHYLFGGLGLPDGEQAPGNAVEFLLARERARDSLNALASPIVTPRGVLVIEGWDVDDWLRPEDLLGFLTRLQIGQAHLFSATDEIRSHQFVVAATERQVLTLHDEPLDEFLSEAEAEGHLDFLAAGQGNARGRLLPTVSGFVEVDVSTWNQVISSARPIDTELLEPFPPSSPAIRYRRFRTFLGASESSPPWRAIASGFKLDRDFEQGLYDRVVAALSEGRSFDPIVLIGQTATGKSLAMCALALRLAREGSAAILYHARRADRPTMADIDNYAVWAERNGMPNTVLVWDGMVNPDEYYALFRLLRSRGRNVLIVGSYYLRGSRQPANHIQISPNLSSSEVARLRPWLQEFDIPFPGTGKSEMESSFLALLYRALPETEHGFRRGLALEMRTTEQQLESLARVSTIVDAPASAMARALQDAGIVLEALTPSERPNAELAELAFAERSSAERLTSLILVAGRRGLVIPLDLALRIVGREGSARIVELVRDFDIFRWEEDESGEQFLGARTQLEAELLAREDVRTATEVEVVLDIIANLRPTLSRGGGLELNFFVDLLEFIGPQSPDSGRYAPHFLDLADALRELRRATGFAHHRLVLSEANLTREFIQWAQRSGELSSTERLAKLADVEQLIEVTLEDADASGRARVNLLVELESAAGAQLYELSHSDERPAAGRVTALIQKVVDAALMARAIDPESVYPVDVVAWATSRAIETQVLDDKTRINLLADAAASLDSLDAESLSPSQLAKYDQRKIELARLLNDPALEAQHLASLMTNQDPAAYFLLARSAATPGGDAVAVALETLRGAPVEVRSDWRCARLMLDLFWQVKAGDRFMKGERRTVPFTAEDWLDCIRLVDSIPSAASFDRHRLQFLRGLALFHLGSFSQAIGVFQELDRDSRDLSSRIITKFLASNPDGTPSRCTGRVTWATPDGRRGSVWVDDLRTEIPFIPMRFSASEYRTKDELLPAFHIAFNMRGPLAEPIRSASHHDGRRIGGR